MNGKKENKKEFSGNVDKFYKVSKEKLVFKKEERLEILLKLKEESMRQGGHFSLPVVSSGENHFHRSSNHQNNRGNSRKGGGKR